MKKPVAIVAIVILLFVSVFVLLSFMNDSIEIPEYTAEVTLNASGDMTVVERWDMIYNDPLSVRFRDIKYHKFANDYPLPFSGSNTAIFDEDSVSVRVFKENVDVTNSVDIGYSFAGDYDELGYPVACYPNTTRCESIFVDMRNAGGLEGNVSFEYTYTILGAVTSFSDISELNWRLFEYAEATIQNATITVNLPANTYSTEDLYVWGHGLSNGTIQIDSSSQVSMTLKNVKDGEFLEFRILAPNTLFPTINARNIYIDSLMNKEVIIDYEADLAVQTNRRILIAQFVLGGAIASIILMAIVTYSVYQKYDKEYIPQFQGDYFRELPSDETPAEMSYLYYMKKINDEDFTATLLDLIRRKYIIIDYSGQDLTDNDANFVFTLDQSMNQSKLLSHEKQLIKWIFSVMGDGKKVTTTQIEKFGKLNVSNAERFQDSAKEFVFAAKREARKRDYFESGFDSRKAKVMSSLFIPGLVLLVAFWSQNAYMLDNMIAIVICIAVMVLFTGYVYTIKKRSVNGNELYAKWKAFRNFLVEFGNMQDYPIPGVAVWEHYLVYATSLKCADLVMEQLRVKLPQTEMNESEGTFLGRSYYMGRMMPYHRLGRIQQSFTAGRSNSFQTIAAANAAKVSSGGRGGGFGGGSSFGGGGGGGRSR